MLKASKIKDLAMFWDCSRLGAKGSSRFEWGCDKVMTGLGGFSNHVMATQPLDNEPIARRVEYMRLERGISVAELARRIGVDSKRLWYVLNGRREMRVDEFLKLCVALGIDPRSFITKSMVEDVSEASKTQENRVGGASLVGAPSSQTTARTVRYTAVPSLGTVLVDNA